MDGNWIVLIEILFIFGIVFVWGIRELRGLRRYRENGRQKGVSAADKPSD